MQIYTGDDGKLKTIQQQIKLGVGTLITASSFCIGRDHHYTVPVALDNGAFSAWRKGMGFDELKFLKMLSLVIDKSITYNFMVTPDIVAGGKESLSFSLYWRDRLAGWKNQYLAVQDGMSAGDIVPHLHKFDGIFIGGTDKWKWETAAFWSSLAHTQLLKLHIGRCGTLDKLLYADEIGADSVDSTNFSRNGDYSSVEAFYRMKGLGLFNAKT